MNKKNIKVKKEKRNVPYALLHCLTTQNNTILTLSTLNGDVLSQASSGSVGFKNSKKATAYAAQKAAEKLMETANSLHVVNLGIYFRGFGTARPVIASVIKNYNIAISFIADRTGLPHGGCRKPKQRSL
jgi:small subunit ribosomal protein S11